MLTKTVENQSVSSAPFFDASLQMTNEICLCPLLVIFIIRYACVSRTMLCGKPLLGITLMICNENKYNSTVDFNKLTQFSTLCLMWLEQSNYTVFPQGSREHIIGFSNAFARRLIEVYFPLLWALTYTSKSNNGFPIVFDIKTVFLFVKPSLWLSGTFMTYCGAFSTHGVY